MAQNSGVFKHAVLSGPPGVGKTTLVVQVQKILEAKGLRLGGFVTMEDKDDSGTRTGFHVLTTDGKTGTLASMNSKSTLRIGRYGVEVAEFERVALPALNVSGFKDVGGVVLLDEIGKMEMYSEFFKKQVERIFATRGVQVLATIPAPSAWPIPFIEGIRTKKDVKIFEVTESNRDKLVGEIVQFFTK